MLLFKFKMMSFYKTEWCTTYFTFTLLKLKQYIRSLLLVSEYTPPPTPYTCVLNKALHLNWIFQETFPWRLWSFKRKYKVSQFFFSKTIRRHQLLTESGSLSSLIDLHVLVIHPFSHVQAPSFPGSANGNTSRVSRVRRHGISFFPPRTRPLAWKV